MFLWSLVSTFFFFAQFVAAHLKECNKPEKAKKHMFEVNDGKRKVGCQIPWSDSEWPFLGSSGSNWGF